MRNVICLLPVVPMRKDPAHRSEMVSQLLFGEYALAGKERDGFLSVRCLFDNYEGWVQANQLTPAGEVLQTTAYTAGFATPVTRNKTLFHVPYGSPVYQQQGFGFALGNQAFSYLLQPQQVWQSTGLRISPETLSAVCQPYLNTPYLWGGKSVWGTDCSGFVQQVFKLFGIKLLRDAYLQAEQGSAVDAVNAARLGDLAFFRNEAGRVTHVGIVLNDGKIIHASGQVRIDSLTEKGIVNDENGVQTHTFHSLRRFF